MDKQDERVILRINKSLKDDFKNISDINHMTVSGRLKFLMKMDVLGKLKFMR